MDIQLNHIEKAYGKTIVFRDFCHSFSAGRAHCILGPSGRGKTTLLRLLAGLEAPDLGSITGMEGKKISAVFQEDRLFENLSAEKNIMLTARRGFSRADALLLLRDLGLDDPSIPIRSCSGGMKRRAAIARALAAEYEVLLLDEPARGLDPEKRLHTLELISRHAEGKTLLCVTHEAADAAILGADVLNL